MSGPSPHQESVHPALDAVVRENGLNLAHLRLEIKFAGNRLQVASRNQIEIQDESKSAIWQVASLRDLFRGDAKPPSLAGEPPPDYLPLFQFLEGYIVRFCDHAGDKTDGEFEEVFSNLRRRPDGKSLNDLHLYMWQVSAWFLGLHSISAAEYEAIYGRLALSGAAFRIGLVSRNYIGTLRRFL